MNYSFFGKNKWGFNVFPCISKIVKWRWGPVVIPFCTPLERYLGPTFPMWSPLDT